MKILIRLPNWLGDMVMSSAFVDQVIKYYPGAEISVIVKKGLEDLIQFFPCIKHVFIFSKDEFSGIVGLINFGKSINKKEKFDLFFCLPNSFSSALMGYVSGARKRIGYKNELRQFFLTHSYKKPENIHRVEAYVHLLEFFTNSKAADIRVKLDYGFQKEPYMVLNINSEASSRRLTKEKAIELLQILQSNVHLPIKLIGSKKEKEFVDSVMQALTDTNNIENLAGTTSLKELIKMLGSARLMLTTDSGPAHLANALYTPVVVLFGAGNEKHTSPYNKQTLSIIRLGQLSCEPCEKNICVRYGVPQCLEKLDTSFIVQTVKNKLDEQRTF